MATIPVGPMPSAAELARDRSRRVLAYPFSCRHCGALVGSEAERCRQWALCKACGQKRRRDIQARFDARKRGEAVPLRSSGPKPVTYPFPCRDCGREIASDKERYHNWLRCRPCGSLMMRAGALKRKYGISLGDFEAMRIKAGNACEICKKPPTSRGLFIDHDHSTGAVRGLLCSACNRMLGDAMDRPEILVAGAAYLAKARG